MIHRRALITGLLASVAAPALARLTQGATTVYYTPYVGDGVALGSMTHTMNDLNEASLERVLIEIRRRHPRGLRITTPRQIRP